MQMGEGLAQRERGLVSVKFSLEQYRHGLNSTHRILSAGLA
jgi:hypothetical protein